MPTAISEYSEQPERAFTVLRSLRHDIKEKTDIKKKITIRDEIDGAAKSFVAGNQKPTQSFN